MSSTLMSCVRENSPPLEMTENNSATLSLSKSIPGSPISSSDVNASASPTDHQQQKRRKFHPLRNLRRIFRRRTVTSIVGLSSNSLSEHNLQQGSTSEPVKSNKLLLLSPSSSPSSPLQHQQFTAEEVNSTQTVVKADQRQHDTDNAVSIGSLNDKILSLSSSPAPPSSTLYHPNCPNHRYYLKNQFLSDGSSTMATTRQSIGYAVLPNVFNNNGRTSSPFFLTTKEKLLNTSDSGHELANISCSSGILNGDCDSTIGTIRSDEMTGSQRSLSEGRLKDCDLGREVLSQSHDSVFSESATASNLSIILKAELSDVLRKRRNRPDVNATDDDSGSAGSPAAQKKNIHSLQRKYQQQNIRHKNSNTKSNISNSNEDSSLGHLSLISNTPDIMENDIADYITSGANHTLISAGDHLSNFPCNNEQSSLLNRNSNGSITSSAILNGLHHENSFESGCEIDLFSSNFQRLSHSAAHHKMAIRPKKKGPSRHRRAAAPVAAVDSSILPSTPDNCEKLLKREIFSSNNVKGSLDIKEKSLSLPAGITVKDMETHKNKSADEKLRSPSLILTKKPKIENQSTEILTEVQVNVKLSSLPALELSAEAIKNARITNENNELCKEDDGNFLRRLIHRSSKRKEEKINLVNNEKQEKSQQQHQQQQQKINNEENILISEKLVTQKNYIDSNDEASRDSNQEIIKTSIIADKKKMTISTLSSSSLSSPNVIGSSGKAKSGPAARQRYIPKDLSVKIDDSGKWNKSKIPTENRVSEIEKEKSPNNDNSKETFKSTSLIRDITWNHGNLKSNKLSVAFQQQKISKSSESFDNIIKMKPSLEGLSEVVFFSGFDSSNKRNNQCKFVEKSKSFRETNRINHDDKQNNVVTNGINGNKISKNHCNNTPSLPNININGDIISNVNGKESSPDDVSSLGFEINDNNLVKSSNSEDYTNRLKLLRTRIPATSSISSFDTRTLINSVSGSTLTKINTGEPKNINEIENNIDLLVKSPFVSVLRNSKTTTSANNKDVSHITSYVENEKTNEVKVNSMKIKTGNGAIEKTDNSTDEVEMRMKSKMSSAKINSKSIINSKSDSCNFNRARRSSSVTETSKSTDDKQQQQNSNGIPEFMKIQLNRVNPLQSKINVVLSKNARDLHRSSVRSTISNMDCNHHHNHLNIEDSKRRFSNENIEISEESTIAAESSLSLPDKKQTLSAHDTMITPITNKSNSTGGFSDVTGNTSKCDRQNNSSNNNSTLNERRKVFLTCDAKKALNGFDDRKKYQSVGIHQSSSSLVSSKTLTSEGSLNVKDEGIAAVTTPTTTVSGVIMRKKSFGLVQSNNDSITNNNNNNIPTKEEDSTPELMKVFARRSLKIKDDDFQYESGSSNSSISTPNVVVVDVSTDPSSLAIATRKYNGRLNGNGNNIDSDKENQSSSEEKLNKLSNFEMTTQKEQHINKNNYVTGCTKSPDSSQLLITPSNNKNRNSLADFRQKTTNSINGSLLENNNKSNNCQATANGRSGSDKRFSPSATIRLNGSLRNGTTNSIGRGFPTKTTDSAIKIINNNNDDNNNDNSYNNNKNKIVYRQQTIERSATVGEFIGIHQRRAEWEKRAKEALK